MLYNEPDNQQITGSGLTSADLCADPLCQGTTLRQLLSEALAHVVVDVIGSQQLLEGLGGVAQVLRQDVAHPPPLPQPLAEVRQFTGLRLDQRVKFAAHRGRRGKGHMASHRTRSQTGQGYFLEHHKQLNTADFFKVANILK